MQILVVSIIVYLAAEAFEQDGVGFWNSLGRQHLNKKFQWKTPDEKGPKNVIIFLGDGMGISMVTAGRIAQSQKDGNIYNNNHYSFEQFDFSGHVHTSSFNYHTTDSAAGAMGLFTGHKVDQDTLGRLPNSDLGCKGGDQAAIRDGIADLAIAAGLDVGIVTVVPITDATPAATYAKDVHRQMQYDDSEKIRGTLCVDIAKQILREPANKFKVIMGGGHDYLLPVKKGGNRKDGRDIEQEWLKLGGKRSLLRTVDELARHKVKKDEHVLGIFEKSYFDYHLNQTTHGKKTSPRLIEMATKAVKVLQASSNRKGYFLMIEGGNIDIAEHANMMNMAIAEMNEFSKTIQAVHDMVGHDTLLLVTADHAHALTLPGYIPSNRTIMGTDVELAEYNTDGKPIPAIHFATGPGAIKSRNYTDDDSKNPFFVHPAAYSTQFGVHGAEDVGLWAQGPYSWLFSGSYENTQVAYMVKFLLCLHQEELNLCTMQANTPTYDTRVEQQRGDCMECNSQAIPYRVVVGALLVALAALAITLICCTAMSIAMCRASRTRRTVSGMPKGMTSRGIP